MPARADESTNLRVSGRSSLYADGLLQPTDAAEHERFQAFWHAHEHAPEPASSRLEGVVTALLPMVALLIVLVVVLAWIG